MSGRIGTKFKKSIITGEFVISLLSDNQKIKLIKECIHYKDIDLDDIIEVVVSIKNNNKLLKLLKDPVLNPLIANCINEIVDLVDDDYVTMEVFNNYKDYNPNIERRNYLINFINEDENMKKILDNWKEYELSYSHVYYLISSIGDDAYKKRFIDETDFNEFSFGLGKKLMIHAINSMTDNLYKKYFITNREKYGLELTDLIQVLNSIHDNGYKKNIVQKIRETGHDMDTLAEVISTIHDDNYKKEIFNNPNEYNFSLADSITMVMSIDNLIYKSKLLNILVGKIRCLIKENNIEFQKEITLPKNMTFGIEIESEGPNHTFIERYGVMDNFKAKSDGSLSSRGVEVISPILMPGEKSKRDIYTKCFLLNLLKQSISPRCGGHIHIGAFYLGDDVEAYKNLIEIFSNTESFLYLIGNEKGVIPREGAMEFSSPISGKVEAALETGEVNFDDISEVSAFANEINKVQKTRYSAINFKNLGNDKNTIEFRLSNGTLNPNTWIENINLFGGIVHTSKIISDIQRKDINSLSEDDKLKLFFFDRLRDNSVTIEDKLDALLSLTVTKEEKKVYLERYNINKQLIEGTKIEKGLYDQSSKKTVKISKKSDDKDKLIQIGYDRLLELATKMSERGEDLKDVKAR